MAVTLTKRANEGFTLVYDGVTVYPSELKYFGTEGGIILFAPGLKMPRFYPPADWTIGGVYGFTTVAQVADALDTLGIIPADNLSDIKTLLSTGTQKGQIVDANGDRAYFSGKPKRITTSVTRPADTNNYDAGDSINGSVAAVKQKDTITLTGTEGTANITVGELTALATFDTDLPTTAGNFVTDNAAAYLAIGIVLTSDSDDLIFEASVAGVPFPGDGLTGSTIVNVTGDLDGTIASVSNVTLFPIIFEDCAIETGGGGYISDVTIVTDAVQFASKTVVLALFNEEPVGLVGDNVAYVDDILNQNNYVTEIEVPIGAAFGSGAVKGTVQVFTEFVTSQSKNLWGLVRTKDAVTAPKSGGVLKIHLNLIQL